MNSIKRICNLVSAILAATESALPNIDCHIWLNTPLNVCMARINSRGRESESNITREYQESLWVKHNEWFRGLENWRLYMALNDDVMTYEMADNDDILGVVNRMRKLTFRL